jgi:hypothetical protein
MTSFAAVIAIAAVTMAAASADTAVRPVPVIPVVSGEAGGQDQTWNAVLYEEDQATPGGSQFAGSASWRVEAWWRVEPGPGRKPDVGMRAHIDIPERQMSARLWVQRNEDKQLAASHTVEIEFALTADFPHGGIASVPGLLMKAGETARGEALKGVSVKVADNLFLIGLSNVDADKQRNVQLIKEQTWLEVPIVYSDGHRAVLAVYKGKLGERATAVLGLPAVESAIPEQPREVPASAPPTAIPQIHAKVSVIPFRSSLGPSERLAAWPLSNESVRPKLMLPVLERPTWAWPPGRFWWALAPGLPSVSWTWQAGWQPVLPEMIKIASRIELPSILQATLPAWIRDTSATMVAAQSSVPPWPPVRAPDFRLPQGHGHAGVLEPPARFVRWSDRLETVLPAGEVSHRCQAGGAKRPPPGKVIRGCARIAAGRCFITRIDDPGVARHELAHCNGWKHAE